MAIGFGLLTVALHELGHYLMARKFGWNPHLGFQITRHPLRSGFMVHCSGTMEIETGADLEKAVLRLMAFKGGGILGALPAFVCALWDFRFYGPTCLLLIYTIWEIIDPQDFHFLRQIKKVS